LAPLTIFSCSAPGHTVSNTKRIYSVQYGLEQWMVPGEEAVQVAVVFPCLENLTVD